MRQSSHIPKQFLINFLPAQKLLWRVWRFSLLKKKIITYIQLKRLICIRLLSAICGSVEWEDPHPLLFIPPPHSEAGHALKLWHPDSSNASRAPCRQEPDTHKLQQCIACSKLLYTQKKFNDETMTASPVGEPPIPEMKRPWHKRGSRSFSVLLHYFRNHHSSMLRDHFLSPLCCHSKSQIFFFPPNAWQKESVQLQRQTV